jgi:hypothetical protein
MKTILGSFFACVALCLVSPTLKAAGETSSGALTVTATVDPSISLTFNSDPSGVALSAEDSAAATLALGHVKAFGYVPGTGITQVVAPGSGATSFSVATPFDVLVMKANTASSNYTLTAALNSADTVNTWSIDSNTVVSGTPQSITSTGAYGTAASHTLKVVIPFSASAGAVTNVINFVATAN